MNLYVIGLGYVGLPLALHASKNGIQVTGFDIDFSKIERLKHGISGIPDVSNIEIINQLNDGSLKFVNELPKSIEKSIYVIAVPTPLDMNDHPDISFLERACDSIAQSISDDCLVVNESTSYIGTLRNLIKPRIDRQSGRQGLRYAVAPERIDPGNEKWNLKNTPRVISGITIDDAREAKTFYKHICDEVVTVDSPEIAEAAKLFENTFRQVNIALVNEFSEVLNGFDIPSSDALIAAATKPFGFMPFIPSIGVGGHCIPIDPIYLSYSADLVNVDTVLIDIANKSNFIRYKTIAERIEQAYGSKLTGVNIQVAGVAYKVGVSDLRESPALKLISELRSMGALVSWHDPLVNNFEQEESSPLNSEIDLGLIITPHIQINLNIWKNANTKVFDLSTTYYNFGWPKFL